MGNDGSGRIILIGEPETGTRVTRRARRSRMVLQHLKLTGRHLYSRRAEAGSMERDQGSAKLVS